MLLAASLEVGGVRLPVKLRNLSEKGALIDGDHLPPAGTATIFCRKDLRLRSQVVWVHGKLAGIAFDEELERAAVLRQVSRQQARPVPPRLYARPAVSRHDLSPTERRWLDAWVSTAGTNRLGE